jgi:hypothetical protein
MGYQSFAYGLGDGLFDIIAKPVQGAQRNGALGVLTGFTKGMGNALCKPAAGKFLRLFLSRTMLTKRG